MQKTKPRLRAKYSDFTLKEVTQILYVKRVRAEAHGCECNMTHKRNVVLYLDAELVRKTRELGFNLSKTCETHLKHVITRFQNVNTTNARDSWWAGPDLNQRPSARQALTVDPSIDWVQFRAWLKNKYAKTWSPTVFCYAKKYHEMLNGDFSELESFSKSKKNTVLKALIVLSKYLGVYREFKLRMTDYGIKLEQTNSVDAFLRTMKAKHDISTGLITHLRV